MNSTISSNICPGRNSNSIHNSGGLIRISYSTITENQGGLAALGGAGHPDNFQFSVMNSIIADNPAGDCGQVGTFSAVGNNVDTDSSCPDFTSVADPYLEPLAANGGGTRTHALTIDSPAINAASGECPTTDQRSEPRPQGDACDLGAYEYDGPMPSTSPPPEDDSCLYEAIRNTNCRVSIYPESGYVATLLQGEVARLIGINTQGTHGYFELPAGEECWMMFGYLSGVDPAICAPIVMDPPPLPGEGTSCTSNMGREACKAAGGTFRDSFGAAPYCDCP
jgi:hypothetical protein